MQGLFTFPQKSAQGGYTLMELAIAMAILAVLIVSGLSGVQGIMTSSKVNDQIKTVARLSSKVSAVFSASGTSGTTNLSTANMAALGGWDSAKVNNGVVTSSFATSESVAPNSGPITDMPANTGLVYTISKVPFSACADLATGISNVVYGIRIASGGSASNVAAWTGIGTEVKAPGAAVNTISLATACALSTSSVDFVIALKP